MEENINQKLFLSEETRSQYRYLTSMTFEKKEDLQIHFVENGIVIPYDDSKSPPSGGVMSNGVIDDFSLSTFMDPLFNKFSVRTGNLPNKIDDMVYYNETVIYLGDLDPFFGHFLTNSLTRLWILLDSVYKKYKVCFIGKKDYFDFLDAFKLFGIEENKLLYIDKITKFKQVIVPEPSFRYWDYWHINYKLTFDKIRENTVKKYNYEKIYLSRSSYFGASGTFGEIPIEKTLKKNGFKIIHPEKYSFTDKVAIFANCKILAGLSGSGMHNILFCNDNITCYIFNRSPCVVPAQILINKMKLIDSYHIDSYIDILPTLDHGFPYLVGLNENLVNFFKQMKIHYSMKIFYSGFSKAMYNFIYYWNKQVISSNFEYCLMKKYSPNVNVIDIAKKGTESLSNYQPILKHKSKKMVIIKFISKCLPKKIKNILKLVVKKR